MKSNYINWEKVKPGTLFGIKDIFGNENYKYNYYFIKYDDLLNELVFYNVLEERLERIEIRSTYYTNDIDFDIISEIYSYFNKTTRFRYLKEAPSKNHLVLFKDTILKGNKSKKYEFFKINKLNGKVCDLESISKGFKINNVYIGSIVSASKIFRFKKENIINIKYTNIEATNYYKSRNLNLILKSDKCHENVFVLVYDDITKKYSIKLIKFNNLVELDRFDYSNSIFNDYIEEKINNCIDSIENGYQKFIPNKGDKYKRLNYETNEEEEVKFNLKNISCFYDLFLNNLFDIDHKISEYEKESNKIFVKTSLIFK